MKTHRVLAILSVFLLALVAPANSREAGALGPAPKPESGHLSIDLENASVASLRLEIFDVSTSEKLWDSGIRLGDALVVPADDLDSLKTAGSVQYELRAWDPAGDLVLSQVSNLASRTAGEIFSIDFEVIPAGTRVSSPSIGLEGDVEVAGNLSTSALTQPGGAPFFQSCPSGRSIREINADGTVICEIDSVGSGGDNLGNHRATTTLDMGNHWIEFDDQRGLRTAEGAEFTTGQFGNTFQFTTGTSLSPGIANIAHFNDEGGNLVLAVTQAGSLDFHKGQKVCSVFGPNHRHSILASAGWPVSECDRWRQATNVDNYQLVCIFDDRWVSGPVNGGAPSPNCGW